MSKIISLYEYQDVSLDVNMSLITSLVRLFKDKEDQNQVKKLLDKVYGTSFNTNAYIDEVEIDDYNIDKLVDEYGEPDIIYNLQKEDKEVCKNFIYKLDKNIYSNKEMTKDELLKLREFLKDLLND